MDTLVPSDRGYLVPRPHLRCLLTLTVEVLARRWLLLLEGKMSKSEKDELKREQEAQGLEMVKRYVDRNGRTRV